MKILTCIPFAEDRNLGREYNDTMSLVGEDDWVCLIDHDMLFATTAWHRQLEAAIAAEPEGCFTAVTNRMASGWQVADEAVRLWPPRRNPATDRQAPATSPDDIAEHRKIGKARLAKRTLLDVTGTKGWGGVLMLVSKRAWRDAGGFLPGMLCVDHMFHYALRDAGRRVWLIEGLYVYHVRGTTSGVAPASFPRALDPRTGLGCPCRSLPDGNPTERRAAG